MERQKQSLRCSFFLPRSPENNQFTPDVPVSPCFRCRCAVYLESGKKTGKSNLLSIRLKQIDQTTRLNEFDTTLDRIVAEFNRENRLVLSGIWEIPFGHGRSFGGTASGWLDHVLGGWQVGVIYQAQTGRPLRFPNAFYSGNTANLVLSGSEQTVDRWFNTSGFVTASAAQPGTYHSRGFPVVPDTRLRQDPLNLWDMNFLKKFRIRENLNVQFRADLLNAMNHAHFDAPTLTPTSGNFGRVTAMWGLPRMVQFSLRILF